MRYQCLLVNGHGDEVDGPTRHDMERFLAGIDAADDEHGAAWIVLPDGRSLEYNGDGRLVYSVDDTTRHLKGVSRHEAANLWCLFAAGDVGGQAQMAWEKGLVYVRSLEREQELMAAAEREQRVYYDSLGSESSSEKCRWAGCQRGVVVMSLYCRPHTFESIRHVPSPYVD